MRRVCESLDEVVSHLKWLAATGVLVVSMGSPFLEIASTVKSTFDVAHMAEAHPTWFGGGPYWIESSSHDHWEDRPAPDLVRNGYAIAFTIEVKLARHDRIIGGRDLLLPALKSYEFLLAKESSADAGVSSLLIKLPSDPADLQELREILLKYSASFAIDDGSGEIHPGNFFMGNGLSI